MLVEAPFAAQRSEDGLLIFPGDPLNCIGYWTINIFTIKTNIFVISD